MQSAARARGEVREVGGGVAVAGAGVRAAVLRGVPGVRSLLRRGEEFALVRGVRLGTAAGHRAAAPRQAAEAAAGAALGEPAHGRGFPPLLAPDGEPRGVVVDVAVGLVEAADGLVVVVVGRGLLSLDS